MLTKLIQNFLNKNIGELEDKNMPGYCVGSVPAAVRKKYTGRAKEVLVALNNAE